MDNQMYEKLETILYSYACDITTAREAKKLILGLGYHVDLRKWINHITEVENVITGELTEIEV